MHTKTPTSDPAASLADVERVVGSWCDGTDPALLSGADAALGVERLARVVRRLQAKQASLAARVEACHSHSRRYASCDDFLARVNGTSRSEAKQTIDAARRLELAPGVAAAAFEQGDLSVGEAKVISAAVAVDPSAEADLVARATTSHDLSAVRERADRVKAAARHGEDPAVRRARLRALRRWQEFDRDGMREVMARFVPDDWVAVAPVVQAYLDAVFAQARRDGRREPIEAYRADAVLAALAAAGHAVGIDPTPRTDTTRTAAHAESDTIARATGPSGSTDSTDPAATSTGSSRPAGCAAASAESTGGTGTATATGRSTGATGTATATGRSTGATGTAAGATESDTTRIAAGAAKSDATTAAEVSDPDAELAALLAVRPERVKWNMILLVDGIALQRGYPTATETCEIVGVGPVDVDLARQILPDATVDVLVHDLVDIRAHATMTRHQKQALKAALIARDRTCVVPDCRRRRWLQADHRHDYALQGPTAYPNMEKLCELHHRQKTHHGARIERVGNEWHWYPPPEPGQPEPPPGTIPWKAKVGQHLNPFDLTDLPPPGGPPDGEPGKPQPGDRAGLPTLSFG